MKFLYYVVLLLLVVLLGSIAYNATIGKKYKDLLSKYDNDFKTLYIKQDSLEKSTIAYRLDIEQLEYINDSLINDLNNLRKSLKIKDAEIRQLYKIKSETIIKDSVVFKDTVFINKLAPIDTSITNDWYSFRFKLTPPNTIALNATYKSDLNVIAYSSKEPIGIPKKCKIGRVFQKKHRVIRVDVKDKNPYSIIKEKRFVIIE